MSAECFVHTLSSKLYSLYSKNVECCRKEVHNEKSKCNGEIQYFLGVDFYC